MPGSFSIKTRDRLFIAGKTGVGKTYLVKHLTQNVQRLVLIDGKGTLTDWNTVTFEEGKRALRMGEPVRIRAIPGRNDEPSEYWPSVFGECYDAGNLTIYIDELFAIVQPGHNAPKELWALYTRGREFGIGVWASTQRPVWIPLVAISEAEHFILFRLVLEEDRRKMAAFMGTEVLEPIRDEHGFFYMRSEWDRPVYYRKLKV